MWEELGEFIVNYNINSKNIENRDEKINLVEIAIGKFYDLSQYLEKEEKVNLIKTDIRPSKEDIVKDDIENPDLNLYKNVDMLYSIRPPYELQSHIMNLRDKINTSLIIKPLTNETLHSKLNKMKLVNYKGLSFYIYEKD